ncbi:uncharacterized protein H6S33_004010 [Morchella sextelata]|uniref:uncharacterized protein n=1 Tax=Morchella sextelata TaxID=1174677 RepID=UPI001D052EC1|nr:uncharacterized protein H6S33_004010 [Morchella sextelata]KAH0606349.1 hypothetical protein H6S33_004010 [Morchella sextelata]
MSDSNQSSIPTIKLKEGEPGISSLSPIGLAFSEAITYINHHKRLNLEEDARKWLIDAASSIIERLKTELEGLYQITSRGDLTKVPLWVTRPSECLSIFIKCPPALSKQYSQEISSLRKLKSLAIYEINWRATMDCHRHPHHEKHLEPISKMETPTRARRQ